MHFSTLQQKSRPLVENCKLAEKFFCVLGFDQQKTGKCKSGIKFEKRNIRK
jgi:hypothetical protein